MSKNKKKGKKTKTSHCKCTCNCNNSNQDHNEKQVNDPYLQILREHDREVAVKEEADARHERDNSWRKNCTKYL